MVTQTRVHLQTLVLLICVVHLTQPVCVDVPSATEAVLGKPMKLTCISCMKREEIKAKTRVDWYYMPEKEKGIPPNKTHIYKYENNSPAELDGPFKGRLTWNGSQDLQDVSIEIISITFNDSGVYECNVLREFEFDFFTPSVSITKDIKLKVNEKAIQDTTALYSEIMMYVLLVFLTFWLVVEMVYCYRKISKSDEQAQDTATNYLAIPSEQKANPAAPVTE
ncbi:sodium channel regulatory subunit beta-3 [Enoplosus armatus]|uniref:sodium channel regulatory subunit beta-3 n=1 Tax=Enoplosus armatus TaxID=215367 RepID=UPI0039961176